MKSRLFNYIQNICIVWVMTVLTIFCMESLSRGLVETFEFIRLYPLNFITNVNRMALITLPAAFFNKTIFISIIMQLPWVIAALANHLMLLMRGTPFIWEDVKSTGEGLSLASQYLTGDMVLKIVGLIGILIVLLIISFKIHSKQCDLHLLERLLGVGLVAIILIGGQVLWHTEELMKREGNDTESVYTRNGFFYSFTNDMLKVLGGENFQEELVLTEEVFVVQEEISQNTEESLRHPNIIMIQLEFVFDPYLLERISYSEDPIPNLRHYMENSYSSDMGVHTFSGGTARTEFEVLAAMNMDYISGGIPYTEGTIKDQGIETIAHVLRQRGYHTTAIHNHYKDESSTSNLSS